MEIICFHNPDEENGYLSNWYLSDFEVNKTKFSSMEQFMMYQKALYFHDADIALKILETSDVAYIKQLGRTIKNYNENSTIVISTHLISDIEKILDDVIFISNGNVH